MSDAAKRESAVAAFLTKRTGISNPHAALKSLVVDAFKSAYHGQAPVLPIDLARISSSLDIEPPVRVSDIEAESLLVPNGAMFSLFLRVGRGMSKGRLRFSWAHELCHTFFYEFKSGSWVRSTPFGSQLEEDLCDLGARSILLPEKPLLDLLEDPDRAHSTVTSAIKIANQAEVSVPALLTRTCQLGFWDDTAFACFMRNIEHKELVLSPMWRQDASNPHVEITSDRVRAPSILHNAFASGGLTLRGVVGDWFRPRRKSDVDAKRYSSAMLLTAVRPCRDLPR